MQKRYSNKLLALISENDGSIDCEIKEDFIDYKNIFRGNSFDGAVWKFNNASFDVTDEFLYGSIDKWDYTPRVHFHHCEWVLSEKDPVSAVLRHIELYQSATFYWHPSPATQRFFVLFYLYLKNNCPELKVQIDLHVEYIVSNIEINLDGNHFLDNLLAITAYALLTNNGGLLKKVVEDIDKYFLVEKEYFPEKTPCYCALLYSRLEIILAINNTRKETEDILVRLKNLLLNNPPVHLNDSYLELRNWYDVYPKNSRVSADYYLHKVLEGQKKSITLIGNGFAKRGYQAHSHDCCAAMFVQCSDGSQLIGGLGTKSYASDHYRNDIRSRTSYFRPEIISKKIDYKLFMGSFRNFSIDNNKYSLSLNNNIAHMKVVEGYGVKIIDDKIFFENIKSLPIVFYSDYDKSCIKDHLIFSGFSIISVEDSDRWDGICNKVKSHKYTVMADSDISSIQVL